MYYRTYLRNEKTRQQATSNGVLLLATISGVDSGKRQEAPFCWIFSSRKLRGPTLVSIRGVHPSVLWNHASEMTMKQPKSGTTITFGTAVPFWGQSSQISSSFVPKRDCGSKWDNVRSTIDNNQNQTRCSDFRGRWIRRHMFMFTSTYQKDCGIRKKHTTGITNK